LNLASPGRGNAENHWSIERRWNAFNLSKPDEQLKGEREGGRRQDSGLVEKLYHLSKKKSTNWEKKKILINHFKTTLD